MSLACMKAALWAVDWDGCTADEMADLLEILSDMNLVGTTAASRVGPMGACLVALKAGLTVVWWGANLAVMREKLSAEQKEQHLVDAMD